MGRHTAYVAHIALRITWAVLPAVAKVALYKHHRANVARKISTTGWAW